jgi:peptide-methionine (S)-S-oxide reductase
MNQFLRPLAVVAAGILLTAFAAPPKLETAIYAGGCFWTVEHGLEEIPGVTSAVSGYTGGRTSKPTYDDVNTETTGHLEAVKVTYDPAKISYAQLTDKFWRMIDPTQADGQACDRAPSYHSAIFVGSAEQRRIAEQQKAALNKTRFNGRVVTEIRAAAPFWPAEDYHQGFARKNPQRYAAYRAGCGRDRILKVVWADQ